MPRTQEQITRKLEKMRRQYAALTEEQREAIRQRHRDYRNNPLVKKRLIRTAKLWRRNRSPQQVAKDLKALNERMTKRYWAMTPEARKAYNLKRANARKLVEIVNWSCHGRCGLKTKHPTGFCTICRTTTCRKCKKSLEQTFIGQRLHERCMPRDSWSGG